MKPFEYAAPETLKEATALLSDTWGETEILAGGTDLVTALKQKVTSPNRLVSLRKIKELRGISEEDKTIKVNAMTSLGELLAHAAVRKHFPSVVTAVEGVASPQLLTAGTVGGDLCQRPRCWYYRNGFGLLAKSGETPLVPDGQNRYHAIFGNEGAAKFVSASALGPPLVALGATMLVTGPKGRTREVKATEFFRTPKTDADRETALQPGEILTSIVIPIQGLRNATYEVRHRRGLDWPYATASVAFRQDNGTADKARVVLGHVAPTPWVAGDAEKIVNGSTVNEQVATKCGEAAVTGARPLSDNAYKSQLVKAAVKRAIMAALQA